MSEEEAPLTGAALIKEVNRLIRLARARWDAHDNGGARRERSRALKLYETLTAEQKDQIPQQLRIWLRYRSVRYFGGGPPKKKKARKPKPPGGAGR